ncbi:hypothetical protein KL86CLO1_12676 [uncultured Eubacteriales bacterium]|uniref:Uncharacterized protein n=1 Tax=uncultured Eubacteriales bacterium TaxID=172733 RepID=A0A212KCY5_9FIRM|nr:hypothetical protein KL86CLO1_12676 [uncultured Eubacteriales bacterium]
MAFCGGDGGGCQGRPLRGGLREKLIKNEEGKIKISAHSYGHNAVKRSVNKRKLLEIYSFQMLWFVV